jgi:hypothetical protein
MADKAEIKSKSEIKPVPSDREGLITSWVNQTADLTEKVTTTGFGIVRDVRGELSARALATIAFLEGAQLSVFKLLRTFNDRADRLSEDVIDTAENLALGVVRTVRDTGRGVTDLATNLGRKEVPKAA